MVMVMPRGGIPPWDAPSPAVLIYHGKHDRKAWAYSTTEERHAAVLGLVKLIQKSDYYWPEDMGKKERMYHERALAGEPQAARLLLHMRQGAEYEGWEILPLET